MELRLENVSLKLGGWLLKNFSAEIPSGSFVSIVGPSGSGKTTVLRIISGLQKPDSGKLFFSGKDVSSVPPEKRNIGFVFQGSSLFPHLSVFENVAFGLKMKRAENTGRKALEALEIVGLKGFEKRNVNSLSGGEMKRVAIARALAFSPSALLLDEPMNGLDAKLKEKMKLFLKQLQGKTGKTMVMVSHDIDEAFSLSDRIIVMNNGKVEQIGKPEEIFLKQKNSFVKGFVSDYVLVEAEKTTRNGKPFIEGKFLIPAKNAKSAGKGKAFINFKKTNYRLEE